MQLQALRAFLPFPLPSIWLGIHKVFGESLREPDFGDQHSFLPPSHSAYAVAQADEGEGTRICSDIGVGAIQSSWPSFLTHPAKDKHLSHSLRQFFCTSLGRGGACFNFSQHSFVLDTFFILVSQIRTGIHKLLSPGQVPQSLVCVNIWGAQQCSWVYVLSLAASGDGG